MWSPHHGALALLFCVAGGCFVDYPPELSGSGGSAGGESTAVATTTTDAAPDDSDDGFEGCPSTDPPGLWYLDGDGDDWGVEPGQVACDEPPGTAPARGDCDDADPERFPGALEVCDGEDDDCDEIIDEFSPANDSCLGCSLSERDGAPHWFCKVEAIDWVAARAACVAHGWTVELLSIHDEASYTWARKQAEALFDVVDPVATFWIGLRRADPHWTGCEAGVDQWQWSDGTPVDFAAWTMGQPDAANCDPMCSPQDALDDSCPRENCGHMLYMEGGWNDRACYAKGVGYACRAAAPP
ncbi:C-type lectin domain-containing protein [Nannocystis sp. SCPEA4]|uniref:C-type lectin domain-containing protein n=1 Tax=Nannocystis sp. SCPEA4 TaxID=2996787 RepID=UPI0022700ECC|nr:C-type lectin domain-containing protein [Nannocystis sp. SCPEA4]MCY1058729.1 C-type lectin domain-containing protein [Nannocystis sp. SCPEA4]